MEDAYQLARMFQACKFMTVQLCNEWQTHCDQLKAQVAASQSQTRQKAPDVRPRVVEPGHVVEEEGDSSSSSDSGEEDGSNSNSEEDQGQFVRVVRQM